MSVDDERVSISPLWRLAPELTVVQAALLLVGCEPQIISEVVERELVRPEGYDAARNAIISAIRRKLVSGRISPFYYASRSPFEAEEQSDEVPDSIDPTKMLVDVESLVHWLRSRGFTSGYFFPDAVDRPQYLDPSHPRYAPKLAAAVEAWQAYDDSSSEAGRPKQRLKKWLRLNAACFGLTGDDGKPTETAIEEIAKVANWDPSGGAPKSSAGDSDVH